MIVKLIRPQGEKQDRWLLVAQPDIIRVIDADAALQAQMEGQSGYFYAEHNAGGSWDIGERAPDQTW